MSEVEVTPQVEYRPILGVPDYRVGDDGSVWSKRRGDDWFKLKGTPNSRGYKVVVLTGSTGQKAVAVHVCVVRAFIGPRPEGKQDRHLNSNKLDNRLSNLKYGTPTENFMDQMNTPNGRKTGWASREVIEEIKRLFDQGESIAAISRKVLVNETEIKTRLCRTRYYRDKIYPNTQDVA